MTIQVLKKEETGIDVGRETSKFTLTAVIALASLISCWAVACLVGGLMSSGAGNIIQGYLTAVFG